MIIGINGKIGSGKDTIGTIIQYLTKKRDCPDCTYEEFMQFYYTNNTLNSYNSLWEIKKFADKLKDIICLLIGCTRKQLEEHEFKNTELGEEWWYYKISSGILNTYKLVPYLNNDFSEVDKAIANTRYLVKPTPRLLLQLVGTECGRNIIHPNVWVNSMMNDYSKHPVLDTLKVMLTKKGKALPGFGGKFKIPDNYPSHVAGTFIDQENFEYHEYEVLQNLENRWIVTDMRFPNELNIIKERSGITIRVVRDLIHSIEKEGEDSFHVWWLKQGDMLIRSISCNTTTHTKHSSYLEYLKEFHPNQHESEIALDAVTTDYTIYNNGTLEELVEKVKEILIIEKIIKDESIQTN